MVGIMGGSGGSQEGEGGVLQFDWVDWLLSRSLRALAVWEG